jgi:hypothetical protein
MSHGVEGGDAETFLGQRVTTTQVIADTWIGDT